MTAPTDRQILDESHIENQILDYDEDSFKDEYEKRLKCTPDANLVVWLESLLNPNADSYILAYGKLKELAQKGWPRAQEVLSRVARDLVETNLKFANDTN